MIGGGRVKLVNFDECNRVVGKVYHGNAGRKLAYLHNDEVWLVKFPQNTRDMSGKHLPEYTSSPLSEYIGSHIYQLLGIPAHETVLGSCQGKVVVGCKDFTINAELLDFHGIKNTVDESIISGSLSSTNHGERLSDVLRIIESAQDFEGIRDEVRERFWDMFVVDAFIRNNDRNNGNWGLLVNRYTTRLAPVFDNGNSFFNKRNYSTLESGVSFFTDDDDNHIHPFDYMKNSDNPDCCKAVTRFLSKVNMSNIDRLISDIPSCNMPEVQKEYYIEFLHRSLELM